jgi:hypothetical protein
MAGFLPTISNAAMGIGIRVASNALAGGLLKNSIQREYNWEYLPPGIGLFAPEYIGQYCQGITFGDYNNKPTVLRYGSETRGYAGDFTISEFDVKFVVPSPDVVMTYLNMWRNLIRDSQGFYSPKSKYALTTYVLIQDTTMDVTSVVRLSGTFPTTFPQHAFTYGGGGPLTYTVRFNCDRVAFL